jgi:FkbM family methyltransferase
MKRLKNFVVRIIRKLIGLERIEASINKLYRFEKSVLRINNSINFRSQSDQDLIALAYFNGRKEGFFIDIGAFDGVAISNTYAFEQIGWKGICVEPLPEQFLNLKKNRKCDLYNAAIGSKNDESVEFITADGYSGFEATMSKGHRDSVKQIFGKLNKIYVKTITFDRLMQNYPGRTHINFMSIDVEGGEFGILKTIDFSKYTFDLITIENNNKDDVKQYMLDNGYHVLFDVGVDSIYIRNDDRTEMNYW